TPRWRIPTSPKSLAPLFFSMISCARRTSVRSISDEDMICAFSHRPELRIGLGGMNAESYAASGNWSKKDNARFPCKYFQMSKIEDLMPEWACLLRPLADTYPGSTQKAAAGRENEEDHQQRKCVKL